MTNGKTVIDAIAAFAVSGNNANVRVRVKSPLVSGAGHTFAVVCTRPNGIYVQWGRALCGSGLKVRLNKAIEVANSAFKAQRSLLDNRSTAIVFILTYGEPDGSKVECAITSCPLLS